MYLSFVVSSSAGIDVSVADRGFESRGGPEVKRLRRLNIIMTVEKDGWLARGVERLSIDQGMQGCRNGLNRLKSGGTQMIVDSAGGALNVGLVFGCGTDAGDPQNLVQFSTTLVVSAYGGLLMLKHEVDDGELLVITNPETLEEIECRIVFLGELCDQGQRVGIEFLTPAPRFWGLEFAEPVSPPNDAPILH